MTEIGLNFRQTSGYVTDGTNETYVIGDAYPTTRGGATFGWGAATGSNRDRSTSYDVSLAGITFVGNSAPKTFRLDLDSTGEKEIRLALGDATSGQTPVQYCQFKDDTTVIDTVNDTNGTAAANFDDATGVNRTASAWPNDNAEITHTFTSTILNVIIGDGSSGGNSTIAHLSVVDAGGGSSAVLTGTAITEGVTESEIVSGGETIIITLTGDTWVATVGADNAITDALIAGITSAQSETNGWNNVVRANMVFGDVARTSDTIVTITLAAEATYSITANETITITIPATALTAAGVVVATPTFDVTNEGVGGIVIFRRRIEHAA